MNKIVILTLLVFFSSVAYAQTLKISGYILDSASHEALIGAYVMNSDYSQVAVSNSFGYFSLELPAGEQGIQSSYVGYKMHKMLLGLTRDTLIQLLLSPQNNLDEVLVKGQRFSPP